ncbi:ABC transporter ATP-binding protein [Blautia liquoris]|uniref:ABC transporter ATP-binding protein n=1 Tax=Blautia liquoris TaxID=2779518 RepID=A0A7M2RKI3_9FIRM|nr:ABC transporter ATP-binding protein [Blautia liquoris]QOV20799.1 ABC transporter ATP-binding protein [Blautia liquoris]
MTRIFSYLKKSGWYILAIVVLLFIQAFTDLSLPSYTSKIIDVGIQQKGIEDAVPDKIRKESLDALMIFMSKTDKKQISSAYSLNGDTYNLNKIDKHTREKINIVLGEAMLMMEGVQKEGIDPSVLPEEQKEVMISEAKEVVETMPESIVTQAGTGYLYKEYQAQGRDMDQIQNRYVLHSGLLMLGLAVISMLAAIMVTFISTHVAAGLSRDLRSDVYRKVLSFSSHEMNRFSTASLITRSTNDVQQVQMFMTMFFRIVLYAPIIGVGGLIKVLSTQASMTWILALGIGLILIAMLTLLAVALPKFKKLQDLIDKVNMTMREILTGVPVIRAFSTQKHEEKRFDKANRDLTKTNLFVNRCMTFMMPVLTVIMNSLTVLIVYIGAHGIDRGNLQVGDMMAFIQYSMQIIMAFLMISTVSIILPRANVSANRINEVLNTEPVVMNPQNPELPDQTHKGEIQFDHVSFTYPGAEEDVLSNINFTAKKGETVAFIGSTGSGKSTLVNLIPRFYDVTQGKIFVDGVDIRSMDLKTLRDRIGYVPQKGVLFSGNIASNLRYGKKDATTEELEIAADVAQASEFIKNKQEGIDAHISQGGTNVSGGQKQRLSIARAVVKKPEIYIFDDSFSALDYKTDSELRKALKSYTSDATTLIVAQRISTIMHADQIIVLNQGKIAGMGTHEELLKTCTVYQQIASSQFSKEELDS